jgi:hypothetical protein
MEGRVIMTMRLEFPLLFLILCLLNTFRYFELFEPFGLWGYIISPIPFMLICWVLIHKFNLGNKRVGNGIGILVLISGPIISVLYNVLIGAI